MFCYFIFPLRTPASVSPSSICSLKKDTRAINKRLCIRMWMCAMRQGEEGGMCIIRFDEARAVPWSRRRILIRAFANVKMSTRKITSWRGALMRSSNIEIVPNCHYRDKWPGRGPCSPRCCGRKRFVFVGKRDNGPSLSFLLTTEKGVCCRNLRSLIVICRSYLDSYISRKLKVNRLK